MNASSYIWGGIQTNIKLLQPTVKLFLFSEVLLYTEKCYYLHNNIPSNNPTQTSHIIHI